jgi:hypothetical protein
MPGGSTTWMTVCETSMPIWAINCENESAKKLKYLKKPRNPRLSATDSVSRDRRATTSSLRAMKRAQKKSTTVEMRMRPRNLQSHHP